MKNLNDTLTELTKAFKQLNEHLFNSELSEPILVIQSKKASSRRNRNGILGWFSLGEVWTDKETGQTNYEITVCAESFNRPINEVLEVLVHEMVHLKNKMDHISDTNSNGRYHNKKFKEAAEAALLECEYDSSTGYGNTKATPRLLNLFSMLSVDENAFNLALEDEKPRQHNKFKMYTYCCGVHILLSGYEYSASEFWEVFNRLPKQCQKCKRRTFHTKAYIDAFCKDGPTEYYSYICKNEYEIEG